MYQHDAQHTGRSPHAGPKYGRIKWKINIGAYISAPSIDKEETLYLGSLDGGLYAVNSDGSIKWKFYTSEYVGSTPAIDNNGTIYFACADKYFYALNNNGTLKWKYLTTKEMYRISPIIDDKGTIYLVADSAYAFTSEGKIKWVLPMGKNIDFINPAVPAISHRGYIYIGLDNEHLYIVKPDGSIWKKIKKGYLSIASPAIDNKDNTYYYSSTNISLVSINGLGNLRWEIQLSYGGSISPVITRDNKTIYFPLSTYLVAFNSNSTVKWDWSSNESRAQFTNSPIIDGEGNIYIGGVNYLFIFSSEGELKNKIYLGDSAISSPVLSHDRIVYITDVNGNLYAIE